MVGDSAAACPLCSFGAIFEGRSLLRRRPPLPATGGFFGFVLGKGRSLLRRRPQAPDTGGFFGFVIGIRGIHLDVLGCLLPRRIRKVLHPTFKLMHFKLVSLSFNRSVKIKVRHPGFRLSNFASCPNILIHEDEFCRLRKEQPIAKFRQYKAPDRPIPLSRRGARLAALRPMSESPHRLVLAVDLPPQRRVVLVLEDHRGVERAWSNSSIR